MQDVYDEISANALMCVLQKSYNDLYKSLFDQYAQQRLLLLPVAHILVNVHISRDFVECHILRETEIPNHYVNLKGQVVEITDRKVITGFGFKNHISANIIRDDKVHDLDSGVKVCVIDDYLMHEEPSCKDIFILDLSDPGHVVESWCQDSSAFNGLLYSALDRIKQSFVMVPGYENEFCSILCSHVDRAVEAYLKDRDEELKSSKNGMCEVTLNFAFNYLNEHLMTHLRRTYQKPEDMLQGNILKLRKEMNLNSTLNLLDGKRQVNNYNLAPSCEALKLISLTSWPQEKLKHLATALQFNQYDSREESISVFILTLVAGGLPDAIANYALLDMYAAAKFCRHKINTQHLDTFKESLQFLLDQV
ncbi:putative integral membrane protein [Babesia bovis T2Bo]|uniref:putative integral membrane protein n=1 Tax=Babesia bovis T2Bo TaxID=484906 RepID=UPI001C345074|nr:putative integral membrane protein [Babesia bovis T2Bo]EDO07831.2 putative integral membrane protein [Babesia bovis T2Bo]